MRRHITRRPTLATLAIVALLCALGGAASTIGYLISPLARWNEFAASTRESLLLVGLVMSVCFVAIGRKFSDCHAVVGRLAGRGSGIIWLTTALRVLAAVLTGYVFGLLPLTVHLALHATWGRPDLMALVDGFAAVTATTVLGLSLGSLIFSRWAVVIVPACVAIWMGALAVFNGTVLVNTNRSSLLLSPVWLTQDPELGWHVTLAAHLIRILFFVCITGLIARITVMTLQGQTSKSDWWVWLASGTAVAMVVGSVVASPHLVTVEPVDSVCTQTEHGATLCLHPADEAARPLLTEKIDRLVYLTDSGGVVIQEGYGDDAALSAWGDARVLPLVISGDDMSDEGVNQVIAMSIVHALVNAQCPQTTSTPQESDSGEAILEITNELTMRAGLPQSSGVADTGVSSRQLVTSDAPALASMSDDEFAQWFAAHRQAIQACTIGTGELA